MNDQEYDEFESSLKTEGHFAFYKAITKLVERFAPHKAAAWHQAIQIDNIEAITDFVKQNTIELETTFPLGSDGNSFRIFVLSEDSVLEQISPTQSKVENYFTVSENNNKTNILYFDYGRDNKEDKSDFFPTIALHADMIAFVSGFNMGSPLNAKLPEKKLPAPVAVAKPDGLKP